MNVESSDSLPIVTDASDAQQNLSDSQDRETNWEKFKGYFAHGVGLLLIGAIKVVDKAAETLGLPEEPGFDNLDDEFIQKDMNHIDDRIQFSPAQDLDSDGRETIQPLDYDSYRSCLSTFTAGLLHFSLNAIDSASRAIDNASRAMDRGGREDYQGDPHSSLPSKSEQPPFFSLNGSAYIKVLGMNVPIGFGGSLERRQPATPNSTTQEPF